ncbi:MAG TPA: hypothetical protein PK771_03015 [Spirochaetota bacterium]|nr:hypothetical protein [Spirochaetota bacterium]
MILTKIFIGNNYEKIIELIIIPLLTFFLGVISSIIVNKKNNNLENINKNITQISDLANEWYNQIIDLNLLLEFNSDKENFEQSLNYIYSRLVLPKYLRCLSFIKEYRKVEKFYNIAQEFLDLVTYYDYILGSSCCRIGFLFKEDESSELKLNNNFNSEYLKKIDIILQKLNIESSKYIK